ncbi:hypothetical protein V6N13_115829 [Hibiscus sabdariffa]
MLLWLHRLTWPQCLDELKAWQGGVTGLFTCITGNLHGLINDNLVVNLSVPCEGSLQENNYSDIVGWDSGNVHQQNSSMSASGENLNETRKTRITGIVYLI